MINRICRSTMEAPRLRCRGRGGDMTNGRSRSKFKICRVTLALMALFMEAFPREAASDLRTPAKRAISFARD